MSTVVEQSCLPAETPWRDERVESNRAATTALAAMATLPPGDPSRERLRASVITTYLPMARRLAKRYYVGGEPLDDLSQVAVVGLINAVDRFDPDRCDVFPAFAVPYIVGELRRHYRDRVSDVRVPRSVQDLHPRLAAARDDVAQALGHEPTAEDLAAHVGVTRKAVVEATAYGGVHRCASLDLAGFEDHAEASGPGSSDEDQEVERADARLTIRPLVCALPSRQRRIVWLRFWRQSSQSEIAADLGISQMHVSRLLRSALATMHEHATAGAGTGR